MAAKKQTRKTKSSSKKPSRKTSSTRSRQRSSAGNTRGGTSRKRSSKTRGFTLPTIRLPSFTIQQKALFVGLALFFLTALIFLSLLSPTQGELTRALEAGFRLMFGLGGYPVALAIGLVGVYLVLWGMDQPPSVNGRRIWGIGLLFVGFEVLATTLIVARDNLFVAPLDVAAARMGGGYFGAYLTWGVETLIGRTGSVAFFVLVAAAGLILLTGWTTADVQRVRERWRRARLAAEAQRRPQSEPVAAPVVPIAPPRTKAAVRPVRLRERSSAERATISNGAGQPAIRPATTPATAATADAKPVHTPKSEQGNWRLPDITEMLNSGSDGDWSQEKIHEQAHIIEQTLASFGAPVQIVDINYGPTVTQFGVEPLYLQSRSGRRMKVKVSKVAGLADDLALALAAKSVRIQAPVPGKGYIGIEVPNPDKSLVSLRDVMESSAFTELQTPLGIGLGQDVAGMPIAADLAKMPHLLVAGATGSGKSVCVNSIIACLLLRNTPDDLRFVMVDPKRVELTGYNGIPHLVAPVVVEMERVVGVLQWALREMDSRYQAFAKLGARNITGYNRKAEAKGEDKLPHIVIIIDELADLMMTSPEDSERAIARLAQMARATGIHMLLSTQRPSVNVVTGIIKANFPARIAFAVASSTDSRVILDTVGAERLLGAGDMLFQRPDAPVPMRMQGCFVSDNELNKLISYWRTARRFHRISTAESVPGHDRLLGGAGGDTAAAATPAQPATSPSADNAPAPPRRTRSRAAPAAAPDAEPTAERAPTPAESMPDLAASSAPAAETPAVDTPTAKPAPAPEPELRSQPLLEELMDLAQQRAQDPDRDELYDDAVAYVRQAQKASTSMLQRRFRIGYTRAARMIDMMEDEGVIGPPTGTSKAREVLDEVEIE